MKVAVLRTDIGHVYLSDVENTSQRNFSSQPAGQSRYFYCPSQANIGAILTQYAISTGTLTSAAVQTAVYGSTTPPFTTANVASATFTALAGISALPHGTAASVSSSTGGPEGLLTIGGATMTLTGLTGMVAGYVGAQILVGGAAYGYNNGTFTIVKYNSATSVTVANNYGVAPDANNGALTWSVQTPAVTALQNLIAPTLIETGPVLLSFAYGKLSILSSATFQPGSPTADSLGISRSLPMGAAVYCLTNAGNAPFTF